MEFYAQKGRELPRFMYRNLMDAVTNSSNPEERAQHLAAFCKHIAELQPAGETQKMKWCMPPALRAVLDDNEAQQLEDVLSTKRKRRNEKLVEVYPHCSDEFSTDTAFLDAAFGARTYQLIDKQTKIFTFGSCFAQNIAHYLKGKGYDVTPFVQVEDLNSPFSNAVMLSVCVAPAEQKKQYINQWIDILYPDSPNRDEMIALAIKQLDHLRHMIASSDFLIMTCGNVVDYFLHDKTTAFFPEVPVAPKFLSVSFKEDVTLRGSLTQRLKDAGSDFRLGDYSEVRTAISTLYSAIRSINPNAHLLITLSPIPIESAMGITIPYKMGAIEIDCISKSLLRSVLYELFVEQKQDSKLYYFPSFEVMRWVAPNFDYALFGDEDACARHISQDNLAGVYEYFLHKFGKESAVGETNVDDFVIALPKPTKKRRRRWWQFWKTKKVKT